MAYVQHQFEPNEVLTAGSLNNLVDGINERVTEREFDIYKREAYDLLIDETIDESAQTKTWSLEDNYYLTTEEPLDWIISYTSYFTKNEIGEYVPVPEATEGADIPDWEENTYYGAMSNCKTVIVIIQHPLESGVECPRLGVKYSCTELNEVFRIPHYSEPSADDGGAYMWSRFDNLHGMMHTEGIEWHSILDIPSTDNIELRTAPLIPRFIGSTDWVRSVTAYTIGAGEIFPAGTRFIIRGLKA